MAKLTVFRQVLCLVPCLALPIPSGSSEYIPAAYYNELPKEAADAYSVLFGSTRYSIPKSYAPFITPYTSKGGQDGKGYAAFGIDVLLPDLKPRGDDRTNMNGTGWHNHLVALVEYGFTLRDTREYFRSVIDAAGIDVNDFTISKNGCRRYQGNMIGMSVLFFCDFNTRIFLYGCLSRKDVPSPYCHVREQIGAYTSIIYDYSEQYADIAVDIDSRLIDLLNSFKSPPQVDR